MPALLAVPFALAGCAALGLGTTPRLSASPTPTPISGAPWMIYASGSATPTAGARRGTGTPSPALPPVSFLPIDPACAQQWLINEVLIPIQVTPGRGSLTVTWPRQRDSDYRLAAVPQPLIAGKQPVFAWQKVGVGTACTVTATITGLKSGKPYVVWLDAPNTGHERDGARHPYTGRSGIVYPT